jgi:hypothetical protein
MAGPSPKGLQARPAVPDPASHQKLNFETTVCSRAAIWLNSRDDFCVSVAPFRLSWIWLKSP